MHIRVMVLAAAVGVGTGGCDVEQGAEDTGTTGEPEGPRCERNVTVLSSLDDVGVIGHAGSEILTRAEGTFAGQVEWISNLVSHQNAGTASPMTLKLTYAGGEIRDVDAELVVECGHLGPCPCEDALEVDMELQLTSEDGALAESMVVSVSWAPTDEYGGSGHPSIYHRFDPDAAPGGLEASHLEMGEDLTLQELVLGGDFPHNGVFEGNVSAQVMMGEGIGFGPFANLSGTRD